LGIFRFLVSYPQRLLLFWLRFQTTKEALIHTPARALRGRQVRIWLSKAASAVLLLSLNAKLVFILVIFL
jgi:hypothetical protein